MKTGDIVTDSRAQAWTLTALLGEGVWSRTWLVKDDEGRQRALKVPYEATDLPPASADKVQIMRKCATEQADLLASEAPLLIPLEDSITLPTGATALLLPWFPTTLQRQLASGIPLTEALHVLLAVTEGLAKHPRAHGNLRPSNILIDPHGDPVVMDLATPSSQTLMAAHERAHPGRKPWAAPDRIAPDTWAICQALHAATMLEEGESEGPAALPLAGTGGLDKVALATLRDRAVARLKLDGANSRFVIRTAERLSTILARGLSRDADPSPPYRFLKATDLAPRLREVVALTDPRIDSVGKLILSSNADGDVFSGPSAVGFTVSVAPTEGVNEAGDIVCGVRLTDLDAPGDGRVPLEDAQFAVDRHPSGRFRFEFNLPEVAPGRYAVRVAFSVKESGQEPVVAEGRFEVRPPAGYVPPQQPDAGPAPIELKPPALSPFGSGFGDEDDDSEEEDEEAPTVMMTRSQFDFDDESDPGAEIIDAFPRPLAPTSPGTVIEDEPEPAPRPKPAPPRPVLSAVPTPPPSDAGEPTEPSEPGSDVGTPAVAVPQPSVTIAAPHPPKPSPVPAPLPPRPEHQAWEASQAGEADFFNEDAPLPGAGDEDLLGDGPRPRGGLDNLKDRVLELLQRDSPTTIGVAVAGCFLLLVLAMALMRAC
ncbi:MAG: hypothetical protein H6737_15680 [Alphaproteobacteria bacterium]|nr:hypothetical protein [Alphaproteobacteria bacterium]